MNTPTAPLLKLTDVCKRFESEAGTQTVLKDLDLELNQGQAVSIVGPSGCGKSTLLNLIGALDRPSSGSVLLDGENLAECDDEALARIRAEKIGFIFQDHHLLPQCTAIENVLIPTLARRSTADRDAAEQARQWLDRVGLADHAHKRPGQLSGGQKQRVAVVRALINRPRLLLADEPTGSLDEESAQNLGDLLIDLNRDQNLTLVAVTHDADLAERVGHVLELTGGKLHGHDSS
ncbi:MAG: ABC transporter ATP-binding protein [Phycisphaeraceae bacterium]|nr:ABC transporter ATP-binding protein [Phycisphaeraceae bacterium]